MENINVFIRLKPLNYQDYSSFKYDKKNLINIKSKENFNFDSIISPITTNEILFENLFKDSLKNLLKGKNITIFTYGQSNTGKTFTLKGNKKNKGLILLSINEIFNLFSNNNEIKKFNVKISYFEIFNEMINDLIENNNKNLEILENNQKGIFINNLSEIQINNNNNEKIEQILNKKEINKIKSDSKEIKLNEKSNKNHLIFKIIIEYEKNDKKFISYLNFIDLAGSENLNKAKFEYIKNKEGSNMNKSLLAFNNIINKLSQNNKNCFINFRESKLTRLIQSIFNGNYKISLICNIIDDKEHYFETLNTIHFGLKAKNIKNYHKNFNENNNNKILIENNRLKNNIKYLEGLINKETGKKYLNNCLNKKNNNNNNVNNNNNNNNNKTENNLNNCQKNKINHLEKEVAMLKKFINKSEEISEINSLNNDIFSLKSGRNLCKNLLESEIKSNKNNNNNLNRFNSLSAMRYTNESAIKNFNNNNNNNDLFNSPFAPSFYNNNNNNNYLLNTEINNNNYYDNNNFRRACFTEMRPNNDLNNYNNNLAYNNNNKFFNFNSNNNNLNISNEIDFNNDSNILRENEELKKTIYEMKKTYYDIIQSKEQQIKLLNQNHNLTIENCEKLIKEAEDNYLNLKVNYEQAMSENKNKENEIITLKQKFVNQETSINYYKDELDKFKDINYITEIEKKYNNLKEENDTLKNYNDAEYKKSIEENNILKEKIKELEDKIKNKNVDFESFKNQMDLINKKNEKEIQKLKIENKNLKSVSSKQNNSNNKKKKLNSSAKSKIKEYETQIKNLQKENNEYKNNMKKIEQIQIIEYQKLLDESFEKINELNKQLFDSKDKVKYLEKALNIVEKTAKKNYYENEEKTPIKEIKLTNFNTEKNNIQNFDLILNDKENDNNLNNIENNNKKEFVNKKRYLPNIYESIAKKNDLQMKSNKINNNNINNDSNNNKNEISNFQI